jgi:hypothetical protein
MLVEPALEERVLVMDRHVDLQTLDAAADDSLHHVLLFGKFAIRASGRNASLIALAPKILARPAGLFRS